MNEPVNQAWLSALRLFCEWYADLLDDIGHMLYGEADGHDE